MELVVRDGRFFTVGDDGAEFFKYKRGDIIFNADQTREIFEKGRAISNNGRGKIARADGTAFATGSGSGQFWDDVPSGGGSSGKKKPSGGSSSSSGSSGKKPSKSGGSSSSSSSSKKGKEKIDWIEIAIDRIERAIDSLGRIAESAFQTLATRLSYNADEIAKTTDEIALQQQAYERYIKEAESVKLKDNLKELVRDGTIDITKYKKKTADLIKEYQEWYRNMPHHVVIHGGAFT